MAADRSAAAGPAGIPNFAWVEGRLLARGRQPPLSHEAYRELREFGFAGVLSLRPEREYPDDDWRSYDAADERALCEASGLTFHHVACTDFQAPHPSEVVRALTILHGEIGRGNAVLVHCLAGVGRTGVVSGAWQMLRGANGTEALSEYAWFCDEVRRRAAALRPPERPPEEFFLSIGAHHQAWVLLAIAKALGRPAEPPTDFVRPQRPANGKAWERRFRDQLQRHLLSTPGRLIAARDEDTV